MSWTITPQTKVPVDPQFGSVSLLLHGNGTNGSTTITDSSLTPKTVTAFGNAQISTAQSKFGTGSISCSTVSDYAQIGSAGNQQFLLSWDFTVEFWIYKNVSGWQGIYLNNSSSGSDFRIFSNPSDLLRVDLNNSGDTFGVIPTGQWAHIAVVRSNGQINGYVNGIGGTPVNRTFVIPSTGNAQIGSISGFLLNAYIDDFRITKGVARYTSNFTPPTAPFPDI